MVFGEINEECMDGKGAFCLHHLGIPWKAVYWYIDQNLGSGSAVILKGPMWSDHMQELVRMLSQGSGWSPSSVAEQVLRERMLGKKTVGIPVSFLAC